MAIELLALTNDSNDLRLLLAAIGDKETFPKHIEGRPIVEESHVLVRRSDDWEIDRFSRCALDNQTSLAALESNAKPAVESESQAIA